jgi:hypothetical protein
MQSWLKIAFWISVALSVLGCFVMGDATAFYLLAALLLLPGFFIKSRLYRIAAVTLFCADLIVAYAGHQQEKAWQMQVEKLHLKIEKKP